VHSFEASPETMKLLERMCDVIIWAILFYIKKPFLIPPVLVEFHVSASSNSGLLDPEYGDDDSIKISVPCMTIDSIMDMVPKVRLVK